MISTHTDCMVQTSYNLNRTCVCFLVKHKTCVLACHHTLLHAFHFVAILLLQTYSHYPSTTCFHTLSVIHLSIPNDAKNIYSDNNLSHAPRIKCLNNWKNTVLTERNNFMAHQGMPGLFLDTNQSQ